MRRTLTSALRQNALDRTQLTTGRFVVICQGNPTNPRAKVSVVATGTIASWSPDMNHLTLIGVLEPNGGHDIWLSPKNFVAGGNAYMAWRREHHALRVTLPCGPPAEVCAYPESGKRWICPNCGGRYRMSLRRNGGWVGMKSWQFCCVWAVSALGLAISVIGALYIDAVLAVFGATLATLCGTLQTVIPWYRKPSDTF